MHRQHLFFIFGMTVGIILAGVFISILPFRWDESCYSALAKQRKHNGNIILDIGWNEDATDECHKTGSIAGESNKIWREWLIVTYKDKEEALKMRTKVLELLNQKCYKVQGYEQVDQKE